MTWIEWSNISIPSSDSLYVKIPQNYTTLHTENPIIHSVLFFKLVKTVSNSSYIAKIILEKGLIVFERMFICKGIIMTNMKVWVFGIFFIET